VTTINLWNNAIGAEGASALADTLNVNKPGIEDHSLWE
jgi:hypothetical protein